MQAYKPRSLEEQLLDEGEFFKMAIPMIGSAYDHIWIPSLTSPEGIEYANDLVNHYDRMFKTLVRHTADGIEFIPAYKDDIRILGTLNRNSLTPIKELVENINQTARERLTPKERAKITHNLNSIRIYLDKRAGDRFIRKYVLVKGKELPYLVKNMSGKLAHFINSWYDTYKPGYAGSVDNFGYIVWSAVDAMDGTLMPEMLVEEDPTEILLTETPYRGIDRVILNPSTKIEDRIYDKIAKPKPKGIKGNKRKYLGKQLCNVNSFRKRIVKSEFEKYAINTKGLSITEIEKLIEQKKKEEEQKTNKTYKKIVS